MFKAGRGALADRGGRYLWLVIWMAHPVAAQDVVSGIDFLNDRLPIPESAMYDEGKFIDSGVGLSFGVDKRLTYYSGQYEEAAERFEVALQSFKHKSEIWVYLARSYLNMRSPDRAKETLERAQEVMPDLREKLWQPLLGSLLLEIRKRANQQQIQIDFYSQDRDDFLSLFRLYLFLEDHDRAAAVIASAEGKDQTMQLLATTVSADAQQAYLKQAAEWRKLAAELSKEFLRVDPDFRLSSAVTSGSASTAGAGGRDPVVDEEIRILQLRIDYYRATPEEYGKLFDRYTESGEMDKASLLVDALDREIGQQDLLKSIAPTVQHEVDIDAQLVTLRELKELFESSLQVPAGETQ